MTHTKFLILMVVLLAVPTWLAAQSWDNAGANRGNVVLMNLNYGVQSPGADLKQRFGNNFALAVGFDYLLRSNWFAGVYGQFMFGNVVKEDVLANLRTQDGFIIGNDRSPADIQLRQRGIFLGGQVGKILPINPAANPRSGIRLSVGAGLLQHNIRVQRDPMRTVAAISGDYRKGYDRLSNGLCLTQFIGYHFMSNDGRLNFYGGAEFYQGFTQNRRSVDYLTQSPDTTPRTDLIYGLRIGWILPFYTGRSADEIYY